jgi:hypothetical protein
MQYEIRKVSSLREHPALACIPRCTIPQFNALCESIKKGGMHQPLTVIGNLVIDGRNRLAALREIGEKECKVQIADSSIDPLTYAVESAVTGRNLTKSGIVLMLFIQHIALSESRKIRKGGCQPEKGTGDSITSYHDLAEKYNVPREYFSTLAGIYDASGDAQWNQVVSAILDDERAITAMNAGLAGKLATAGKKRADPKYHLLAPQSAVTMCSVFKSWGKINWGEHTFQHTRALAGLTAAFGAMPDEVRALNARAVLEWPEHERTDLLKALKSRSGK